MHTIHADDLMNELNGFDPDEASNAEKLETAQTALFFAICLLEEVADDTSDGHARAYLIDHLKIKVGADHGFLSRDFNIDEWVERLDSDDE